MVVKERDLYQIGEVSERVGLSLRTLRYYEEVGIAPPSGRSAGGFRLYSEVDLERLAFIKRLKPLELSLDQIRELLETRERLAVDASDPALGERLQTFARIAEERGRVLMAQARAAEALAASLRRLFRRSKALATSRD